MIKINKEIREWLASIDYTLPKDASHKQVSYYYEMAFKRKPIKSTPKENMFKSILSQLQIEWEISL